MKAPNLVERIWILSPRFIVVLLGFMVAFDRTLSPPDPAASFWRRRGRLHLLPLWPVVLMVMLDPAAPGSEAMAMACRIE